MIDPFTIEDDFDSSLSENIWRLSKINKECYKIVSGLQDEFPGDALEIRVTDKYRSHGDGKEVDRTEIAEVEEILVPVGKEVWYSFEFYFPKNFLIIDNRLVFAQWKRYTLHYESPMLSVRYINSTFSFKVRSDNVDKKYSKQIDLRGRWHRLTVNYKLNENLTGFCKGWLDDELVMDYSGELDYKPAPDYMFMKMGLYRDSIDQEQRIYFRKFRRSGEPLIM